MLDEKETADLKHHLSGAALAVMVWNRWSLLDGLIADRIRRLKGNRALLSAGYRSAAESGSWSQLFTPEDETETENSALGFLWF